MAQKRHHYVPAFLLRRFARPDQSRGVRVYRLNRKTGQILLADPKTEAQTKHLYRIVDEDGTVSMEAEHLLGRIEAEAAPIIARLAEPGHQPSAQDRSILGLFVVMQRLRTPFGREWIKQIDELLALEQAKVDLRNAAEGAAGAEPHISREEAAQALADLAGGSLFVESPPSRQTALMFMTWQEQAAILVNQCEWAVFRAPAHCEFVLSDNPVVHFDPTLERVDGGLGFASSGYAHTSFPVDPRFCICLRPLGHPQWSDGPTDAHSVEEINLATYAWADRALYGRSQKILSDLRILARETPRRLARYPRAHPAVRLVDRRRDAGLLEQAQRRISTLPPNMIPG